MEQKKMTRDHLLEILAEGGTKDDFDLAVVSGELSAQEAEKIYAFLIETDPTKQKTMMDEIMRDVVEIPTYDTARDGVQQWKQVRNELLLDVRELQSLMTQTQKDLDAYKQQLKAEQEKQEAYRQRREESGREVKNNPRISKEITRINAQILAEEQRLSKLTLQYNAASLMHSYAKTQQGQENAKVFAEYTKPMRDMLKDAWSDLSQKIGMVVEHFKQRAALDDVVRSTKHFDRHPIQDLENRFFMNIAKHEAKSYNRRAARVDKLEQKILDKANKIRRAEYRKEHGMGAIVSAFAKGQKVERPEFKALGKADLDIAKEMLGQSHLTKAHKHAVALRDSKKESLDQTLSIVAKNLSERRQAAQQTLDQVIDRANRGDFGYSDRAEKKLEEIGKNLGQAAGGTAFRADQLDPTLLAYLNANGHTAFFDQNASFSQDLLDFGNEQPKQLTQEELNGLLWSFTAVEAKLGRGEEMSQPDLEILSLAYEHGLDIGESGAQALLDANERGEINLGQDVLDELEELISEHSQTGPTRE